MVVGHNNGVVRLTGFSNKKMSGLLFRPQRSGLYNGVVVWWGSTVPVNWLIVNLCCSEVTGTIDEEDAVTSAMTLLHQVIKYTILLYSIMQANAPMQCQPNNHF